MKSGLLYPGVPNSTSRRLSCSGASRRVPAQPIFIMNKSTLILLQDNFFGNILALNFLMKDLAIDYGYLSPLLQRTPLKLHLKTIQCASLPHREALVALYSISLLQLILFCRLQDLQWVLASSIHPTVLLGQCRAQLTASESTRKWERPGGAAALRRRVAPK